MNKEKIERLLNVKDQISKSKNEEKYFDSILALLNNEIIEESNSDFAKINNTYFENLLKLKNHEGAKYLIVKSMRNKSTINYYFEFIDLFEEVVDMNLRNVDKESKKIPIQHTFFMLFLFAIFIS